MKIEQTEHILATPGTRPCWGLAAMQPSSSASRRGRLHSPSTGTPTATTRNFHAAPTPAASWLKSVRANQEQHQLIIIMQTTSSFDYVQETADLRRHRRETTWKGVDPTLKDWLRIIINELENIGDAYRCAGHRDEWKAKAFEILTARLGRTIEKLEQVKLRPDCFDLADNVAGIRQAIEEYFVEGSHTHRVRQMSAWINSIAYHAGAHGAPALLQELEDIGNDLVLIPPPTYENVLERESETERRQRQLTDALAGEFRYWGEEPAAEFVHAILKAVDCLRQECDATDEDEVQDA